MTSTERKPTPMIELEKYHRLERNVVMLVGLAMAGWSMTFTLLAKILVDGAPHLIDVIHINVTHTEYMQSFNDSATTIKLTDKFVFYSAKLFAWNLIFWAIGSLVVTGTAVLQVATEGSRCNLRFAKYYFDFQHDWALLIVCFEVLITWINHVRAFLSATCPADQTNWCYLGNHPWTWFCLALSTSVLLRLIKWFSNTSMARPR